MQTLDGTGIGLLVRTTKNVSNKTKLKIFNWNNWHSTQAQNKNNMLQNRWLVAFYFIGPDIELHAVTTSDLETARNGLMSVEL